MKIYYIIVKQLLNIMIGVNIIGVYKSGIKIKKSRRGLFTEYCGGEVTDKCIQKAKKSKNPKLRKRATFAQNSRSWSKKHEEGAKIHKPYGHKSILDNGWQSTKELKKKRPLIAINANGGQVSEGTKKPIDKKSQQTNEPKKKLVVKRQVNPTGMVNKRPIPGLLTNELVAQNTKKSETKK